MNRKNNLFIFVMLIVCIIAIASVMMWEKHDAMATYNSHLQEEKNVNAEYQVEAESRSFLSKLISIEEDLKFIQKAQENFFDSYLDINIESEEEIHQHDNGSYYKRSNDGGSAFYYAASINMNEHAYKKAVNSLAFDADYKTLINQHPMIKQAYTITHDNMVRIYPYIDDFPNVIGKDFDANEMSFYYLADEHYNPNKELVWTSPYYDIAGRGWIISLVAPLYSQTMFEGVVGLDIKINELDQLISGEELSFILCGGNKILTATSDVIGMFDMSPTLERPLPIESNQFADSRRLADVYVNQINNGKITIDDIEYLSVQVDLSLDGWTYVKLFDVKKLYADSRINLSPSEKTYLPIVIASIIILLVTMVILMLNRKNATGIETSIISMNEYIKTYINDNEQHKLPITSDVKEINDLRMNLIDLMKHMEARTKKLLKSQIDTYKAEEAAKQHKIDAMIDKLTGLYNRRKIDEVLENELKRSIRYRTPFTLLIIDVDNFKVINDQYGHAKGDDILIDVAGILNSTVRNTDFVGRWGGDEFVIIAVESTEMQTRTLADKIVEGFRNYDKGINISTSIGMAQVNVDRDDTRSLLQKADEALYVAKSSGRNCTVAYKDLGAINEK